MARIIYAKVVDDIAKIKALPPDMQAKAIEVLKDRMVRRLTPYRALFPDRDTTGEDGQIFHARELYPKQLEFFAAGAVFRERALMAANRVGKTIAGAYETTAHLTGDYPHWWTGRVFKGPTRCWAVGKTNETARDIVQRQLLGNVKHTTGKKLVDGTGMIPGELIGEITWKQGVSDLVDTVKIRHKSSKTAHSLLGFKSYQQGRGSFEGTEQHVVWLDEECPKDIYDECLIRTTTTKGLIMLTFTPLEGLSETALAFMPAEQRPNAA